VSAPVSESGLVSVITPCYNANAFVGETIAAVAAQTYSAIEHIVIDDGSTDGSWETIRAAGSRIVAVRSDHNRGAAHARNQGVDLARGSYLMFLDADDTIAAGTVQALVRAIRGDAGAIAVCRWHRYRRVAGAWRPETAEIPLPPAEADHLRDWIEGIWVPPCAVLWPRSLYEATGGWDESLSYDDDCDLMLRALVRGARLVHAPGGEAMYREHGTERLTLSTDLRSERSFRSGIQVNVKLVAELEAQKRLDQYAEAIGLVCHRLALLGFRWGHDADARECLQLGARLAGRQDVSRTLIGRVFSGVLGIERKEHLFNFFARHGLGSRDRRQAQGLRKKG
jgi:glycosyltransferase involved in cell wall biosynthesis